MPKHLRLISHKLCQYVQREAIIAAEKRIDFERDATFFTSNLFVVSDFNSALAIFINIDKAEYMRGC